MCKEVNVSEIGFENSKSLPPTEFSMFYCKCSVKYWRPSGVA